MKNCIFTVYLAQFSISFSITAFLQHQHSDIVSIPAAICNFLKPVSLISAKIQVFCINFLLRIITTATGHKSTCIGMSIVFTIHLFKVKPVMSVQINPSRKHAYIILTPLNPTFIKLNWSLDGYTLFSLFLLENIDCGYPLEPPRRGSSNEYPQSMF